MTDPTHATGAAAETRADLRLVPAASAAWLGALAAGSGRSVPAVALAVAGALLGAAVLLLLRPVAAWALVLGAALACGGAVLAATTVRAVATGTGVVAALAQDRAVATVDLVVTGDPRVLPSDRFGPAAERVLVRARVHSIDARGHRWRTRVPVVLVAESGAWAELLPSQHVRADVRLAPARPGDDTAALLLARGPPDEVGPPSRVQRVAGVLRAGLRDSVAGLPAAERGLLPGLVVGDTSAMPPGLVEDFRSAGLTHLVAVSGANVAIVLAAVLLAARWGGLRARAVPAAGLLAILAFLVLARAEPSVLRATVCGVVAVVALGRGGRAGGVPALCAAIVVLLLIDPSLGRSYGFALSVLATAGLIVLAPGWRARLARVLPSPVADAVAVPAAAQAACAPVLAMLSAGVSLVAVPANLLVAPAVAPATVLGVLIALVAPLLPPVAHVLAAAAWLPSAWIVLVARVAARLPGATLPWPDGIVGGLLLAGAAGVLWLFWSWLARRRVVLSALVLAAVVCSPLGPRAPWPPRELRAVFCDVGQGDAIVVPTGPGRALLVDAGPDPEAVDRCLTDLGVRALDAVVLTHFHADHVEGLPGALAGRSVAEVVVGPIDDPEDEAERVNSWAADSGVPVRRVVTGEERAAAGVTWRVLWPRRVIRGDGSVPNNASIVVVVDTGGVRLLLTGDVERAAQSALLPGLVALEPAIDVLKVPHHGSRSQDLRLVDVLRPRLAVISVGAGNTYGHPAEETVASYTAQGIPVLRTDLEGDVAVVGSGEGLRLVPRR